MIMTVMAMVMTMVFTLKREVLITYRDFQNGPVSKKKIM